MIQKNIKRIILEHFFENPSSRMRLRQIERKLNLSFPSVVRYVRDLKKEGLLKEVDIGNVIFITSNRTNPKFLIEKRVHNFRKIFNSGLVEHIKEELHNPNMVVFGSYSKGEDIEGSDIDLFIETASKKKVDLAEFEKKFGRKIQVIKEKSVLDITNKNLANNIMNGIVINGYVEVF